MNYIYYQTKTKFINTGDALINKALIDCLRNYGQLQCNCSEDIPKSFIQELGIKEDEKITLGNEFNFIFHIIKKSLSKNKDDKIYIFSGLGHNFGGSLRKIIRNIITGLFIFPIYRILGVKIIRIGMSIGPITKALGVSEKIRSFSINHYLVRDKKSLQLCKKIGIKKAELLPDLSWMYNRNHLKNYQDNTINSVVICLRDCMFDAPDLEYKEALIKQLDVVLENINSKGSMKLLFMYQVAEDKNFTCELYERYKDKYKCELNSKQVTLFDAEAYYSKYKYNISNRMHSILLGYKYGSLPIVLTDFDKHTKISQTLIDNDIEHLTIDIYGSCAKEIKYILANYIELINQLYDVEEDNQNIIIEKLNYIFNR